MPTSGLHEDPRPPAPTAAGSTAPHAERLAANRRNRRLGAVLAGVGGLIFALCVGAAALAQYAEAHHLLAGL